MSETRSRMISTALLVLVALGGAGLAGAADRPHNPIEQARGDIRAALDETDS